MLLASIPCGAGHLTCRCIYHCTGFHRRAELVPGQRGRRIQPVRNADRIFICCVGARYPEHCVMWCGLPPVQECVDAHLQLGRAVRIVANEPCVVCTGLCNVSWVLVRCCGMCDVCHGCCWCGYAMVQGCFWCCADCAMLNRCRCGVMVGLMCAGVVIPWP